jgi:hypothetical protein
MINGINLLSIIDSESETFSVNNWCAGFLIFSFSDPHGLEGR